MRDLTTTLLVIGLLGVGGTLWYRHTSNLSSTNLATVVNKQQEVNDDETDRYVRAKGISDEILTESDYDFDKRMQSLRKSAQTGGDTYEAQGMQAYELGGPLDTSIRPCITEEEETSFILSADEILQAARALGVPIEEEPITDFAP